jgi:hypothetical protein
MDKQEFIKTLSPFASLYGANLTSDQARLWFESCQRRGVSAMVLKRAFERYVDTTTNHWFPTPGEVLSLLESKSMSFEETPDGKQLLNEFKEVELGK